MARSQLSVCRTQGSPPNLPASTASPKCGAANDVHGHVPQKGREVDLSTILGHRMQSVNQKGSTLAHQGRVRLQAARKSNASWLLSFYESGRGSQAVGTETGSMGSREIMRNGECRNASGMLAATLAEDRHGGASHGIRCLLSTQHASLLRKQTHT